MSSKRYNVRKIDFNSNEDRDQSIELLNKVFGGNKFTPNLWTWKFLNSPFGKALGICACDVDSHKIIGLRIAIPWQFYDGKENITAYQMVDTVTDPNYQGQGIFSILTKQILDEINGSIIFNFPNPNSAPINLKLGWEELANNPWILMMTRPTINKSVYKLSPLTEENINEIIFSHSYKSNFHTNWNVDLIKWRFCMHPNVSYNIFTSGNDFVIYRIDKIKGFKMATMMCHQLSGDISLKLFRNALFRDGILFCRYNALNDKTYKDFLSKCSLKIKGLFRYFSRNNYRNLSITLTPAETDFL